MQDDVASMKAFWEVLPPPRVYVDADATIDSANPDTNLGSATTLELYSDLTGAEKRILLRFTVPEAKAVGVTSAVLELDGADLVSSGQEVAAYTVTGDWTEGGVTWNTQPALDRELGRGTTGSAGLSIMLDASRVPPEGSFDVILVYANAGSIAEADNFHSREGNGVRAYLSAAYEFADDLDLHSHVLVRRSGDEVLASTVEARFSEHLAGVVLPRFTGAGHLGSSVQPTDYPVRDEGELVGRITPPLPVEAVDFVRISAEVGSDVEWTSGSVTETKPRIVQLVRDATGVTFPRTRTSEGRDGGVWDRLRRGDAVLYATAEDTPRPGDVVTWQGHDWTVVGDVGEHRIHERVVYREVGLRRSTSVDLGRVVGVRRVEDARHLASVVVADHAYAHVESLVEVP